MRTISILLNEKRNIYGAKVAISGPITYIKLSVGLVIYRFAFAETCVAQ